MPFISVKLDAKESKVAPEGRHPLRIQKWEEKKTGDKAKNPGETYYMIMITNESPDGDYAPVFHNLMLPSPKQDEGIQRMRKLDIQRLLAQFNVPGDANGFDLDDLVGATAEGMLTLGETDKGEPRNELRLDRLDAEEEGEADAPKETPVERSRNRRRGRGGADEAEKEIPF